MYGTPPPAQLPGWSQPPETPPPETPPPTPPRRRHWKRWAAVLIGVPVLLIVIGIVASAVGGSSSTGNRSGSTPAATAPSAAPSSPGVITLSATQQSYVDAMRSRYNFKSDITDQQILVFGQGVCNGRSTGDTQATAQQVARSGWTNMGASDAYSMTRLAESSLCPAWLPAIRWHTIASYSGTGMWNSPPFRLHPGSTMLRVKFGYSGNSSGFGGDNFIADLVSPSDDLSLANDIAVSGGQNTTVYPDTSFGGSRNYHLEVTADSGATWYFVIKQRY